MPVLYKYVWTLAAICLGLSALGCGKPLVADAKAPADQAAAVLEKVTAAAPVRKDLALYSVQPGKIVAFEETPLYPRVSGYIRQVSVDIGDRVKQGQPLVELTAPELEDDVHQKQAALERVRAEVQQAEKLIDVARAAVEFSTAQVHQTEAQRGRVEADCQRWKSEYERITELAEKRSVTPKLAEEILQQKLAAEAGRVEVEAKIKAAQAGVRQAEVQVAKAQADLQAVQAQVRVAEADLDRAKTMLGYLNISAPFDGAVVQRNVDTGHLVSAANGSGAKPLVAVARTDLLRVVVDIPESEAALVDSGPDGDEATIRSQAVGQRELTARVTRTSWSLDESNRSLRVELEVPNQDDVFRPGMYATARILLDSRKGVLTVPATAIVVSGDERFCMCVQDGKIVRKPVKVGLRANGDCEIAEGLAEGDLVVQARADALKPDQPVELNQPQP